MLLDRFGVDPISPIDGTMIGSMATIPLPRILEAHPKRSTIEELNARLYNEHGVEVPVMELDGTWFVRISAQVYNELEDYHRLADAIDVLAKESG